MTQILDGRSFSRKIEEELKCNIRGLKENYRITPHLAAVLVGNNSDSQKYVQLKKRACERVGIRFSDYTFSENASYSDVYCQIIRLNYQSDVHGILLQHPVALNIFPFESILFETIVSNKDVDGVTSSNFGKLGLRKNDGFKPATPYGIMRLLKHYNISVKGKIVTVVGMGPILGKPLALMFMNEGATVISCNKETPEYAIKKSINSAKIVVGACGVPGRIKAKWVNHSHVLIDAGYTNGKGDIEEEAWTHCRAYTPVPGGVGPMTIATLLMQTFQSAYETGRRYSHERTGW